MKRINLFFITIASMFVFSIQAMKLNQPDQLSDLNVLAKCCFVLPILSKSNLFVKQEHFRRDKPVFKHRRCIGLQRFTIKPKNRCLSEYTPVNTEFCRKDGVVYLQLLMKANAKKDQNFENQERWKKLKRVAPNMMNIMLNIGNDDVAQYIIDELI